MIMMTIRSFFAAFLALACLAAPPASARPPPSGALRFSGAWISPPPNGARTAAGYITISNTGRVADRLMAIKTSRAADGEIHLSSREGGIVRMREVTDGVPLPAGQTVALRPGGYHLMFRDPTRPFRVGDRIVVRLLFARSPEARVPFIVDNDPGGPEMGSATMPGRPM
jgi:copper(I)-binding protein